MIRHCRIIAAITISIFLSTAPAVAATKVFLLGGQSNMDGRALVSTIYSPYGQQQPDVKIWDYWNRNGGGWQDLRPGYTTDYGFGNRYGPEVSFGYALNGLFPGDDIYLVKYANGGTTQAVGWNPNGSGVEYNMFKSAAFAALQNLTSAGKSPEIAGMIWMQGESDALDGYASAYEDNLRNFISEVRDDFGVPDMPFALGRIITYWGSEADNATVRDAQVAVAEDTDHVAWIDTDDLSWDGAYDGHYGTEGQIILGQRFAGKIVQLPEPSTLLLLAIGMAGLSIYFWRNK